MNKVKKCLLNFEIGQVQAGISCKFGFGAFLAGF